MRKPKLNVLKHELGLDITEAYIIPLSDLHIGSHFCEDKFLGYREWILNTENAYCIINGDVLEMVTRNSVGDIHQQLRPKQQKELAIKYLKPLADAGKILAYVEGNHDLRANKDTDEYPGEYICGMMGVPSIYSPDGAYLFINCGYDRKANKNTRLTYTMYALHGWTGSRRIGGKANQLEELARGVDADIYVASHTHQKFMFPVERVMPDTRTKTLSFRRQVFVSAGSFLDWDGYAIRRGYTPAALGSPRIRLDGERRDVHVSI